MKALSYWLLCRRIDFHRGVYRLYADAQAIHWGKLCEALDKTEEQRHVIERLEVRKCTHETQADMARMLAQEY